MSAEPLPAPAAPAASAARARRAEGLTRAVLGRPVLRLVPTPTRARRAPFVALVLGILLLGLIGLLLLNTASAQDAFRLHRLQISAADVNDQRQELSEQVNRLTGPAGLAAEAQKLGMVPMETPVFWKPGDPLPPGARVIDGLVVVPAATPAAKPPAPAVPAVPVDPAAAKVTSVPRPGQKPAAKPGAKPSTSTAASPKAKPSTAKPSTGAAGRQPAGRTATKPTTTKPTTTKPAPKSGAGTSSAARTSTGTAGGGR